MNTFGTDIVPRSSRSEQVAQSELRAMSTGLREAQAALEAAGAERSRLIQSVSELEEALNRANAIMTVLSEEVAEARFALSREVAEARSREKSLQDAVAALEAAQAARLAIYDPDRPTLGGLFRVVWRNRFFVPALVKAPLNSAKNLWRLVVRAADG